MTKPLPPREPSTGRFVTKEQPSKAHQGSKPKPEIRATTHKQPPKGGKQGK